MTAQVYVFTPSTSLRAGGALLTPIDAPAARPLRWAAWHPDGQSCLVVGNGGTVLRYASAQLSAGASAELSAGAGERFEAVDSGTKHNLRGAAYSPDPDGRGGAQALLVGNRGAVLLYDGESFRPVPSPTHENLRRVAWRPDPDGRSGALALIVGNAGVALRYEDGALTPVPGDRAHTLRAVAWRPDGSYALVGAYSSHYAGYPRPHALYKYDGLYLQALLTSDQEDDFVAIDWRPATAGRPDPDGRGGPRALIAGYAFEPDRTYNKLLEYDGAGFSHRPVEASGALLGAAWHPSGEYALLCGEGGTLLRYYASTGLSAGADGRIEQLDSGTDDNLVGPFWKHDGSLALFLRGPAERVYTV